MCKAKDYASKLIDIYNDINHDYQELIKQEQITTLYEQDILHIIENTNFSAADGYKLAKMIKDNRNKRRQIKNEVAPMKVLKDSFINNNMNKLIQVQQKIERENKILSELSDKAIYNPRTEIVDGEVISKKKTPTEKRNEQKQMKKQFIHNATIKTSGIKVCVLEEVNEKQLDCIVIDENGGYNRCIVNKIKLIDLDGNELK